MWAALGGQMGQVCKQDGLLRKTRTGELEKGDEISVEGGLFPEKHESRKQVEGSSLRDSGMAIMSILHSIFFRLFPRLALPTLSMV